MRQQSHEVDLLACPLPSLLWLRLGRYHRHCLQPSSAGKWSDDRGPVRLGALLVARQGGANFLYFYFFPQALSGKTASQTTNSFGKALNQLEEGLLLACCSAFSLSD